MQCVIVEAKRSDRLELPYIGDPPYEFTVSVSIFAGIRQILSMFDIVPSVARDVAVIIWRSEEVAGRRVE